jgi:hypothetical protein
MNDTEEEFNKLTSERKAKDRNIFNVCLMLHFSMVFDEATLKTHKALIEIELKGS